jgi:error-prone DNA polymerase
LWGERVHLGVSLLHDMADALWLHITSEASRLTGVSCVATSDVRFDARARKPLHDVMTAIRLGLPVAECGQALQANAQAHLRERDVLARQYPAAWRARTLQVAARCRFSLQALRYQYPMEAVPAGSTPSQELARLSWQGAARRYPQGVPEAVRQQVLRELALIAELRYEMYFLTVNDIVAFARSRDILCQGRGSAANSAVCYCLGVTEVDPARTCLLFERFISRERNEPPDIDVDFEHQRREEVIQYIYQRYGRHRAAIAATVISYRPRSALRDVGKALGVPHIHIEALAREHFWFDGREGMRQRMLDAGLNPDDALTRQWLTLARQLMGLPRHLSQHVGGFVLTQGPLTDLVPVENAAMPDRSIIQWDKDDLDAMGLLKVDVLALGMLSALRRCLDLVSGWRGQQLRLQDIADGDEPTYDMICDADTVGVFQIESRAQMSMLPRLQPRTFYDLVIEVAIVRPGPIQGGMVHPYLRRRQGLEPVEYPSEALREALGRTLGVPIFQEQVMQIAMLAAGFSADEADQLRRSMAAWKRKGGVHRFYDRIITGMTERGYTEAFAQGIFRQIEGFGEYGFPESHAASFALLVYASCWLKRHEPACFLAALLNSQPLGFYSPSQLVQDAQRHGVQVRPVDVMHSDWDCTLEAAPWACEQEGAGGRAVYRSPHAPSAEREQPVVRLGLRMVAGLSADAAARLVAARAAAQEPWGTPQAVALDARLDAADLRALAAADALVSLAGHRRQQVWEASALHRAPALLRQAPVREPGLVLPPAPEGDEIAFDFAATGLTLRRHPLALLRPQLQAQRVQTAAQLQACPDRRAVRACGLVTVRQQPGTAKGVMFITLEDETGTLQVIVWKALRERQRRELLHARLLAVHGIWQREASSGGKVCHLIAGFVRDLTPLLGDLATQSRDFH